MTSLGMPNFLFVEPTIGIPLQPLLVDEMCSSSNYASIIWLQNIDQYDGVLMR